MCFLFIKYENYIYLRNSSFKILSKLKIPDDEMMDSRWAKQVKTRALRLEKIMRTGQLLS